MRWAALACALALGGVPAGASALEKIRDNLFLLEEAYNQEPGVIQHIQVLRAEPETSTWEYSFTEEWPVPTDRHQLSVTVPLADGDPARLGDLLVNYRLQVLGMGGEGWLAVAPRLSLVVPTGDAKIGAGRGGLGVQLNLPASMDLCEHLVAHVNAGLTWTPAARSLAGPDQAALDSAAGVALVWLPTSWANLLVEVLHETTDVLVDAKRSSRASAVTVSPGVRFAINAPRGLQIVPGLAAPIDLDAGEASVLAYLSFEHPLW